MVLESVAADGIIGLALVWQRPGMLWLLVLPPLVLLFARIPARPREVATGTLALWRAVALRVRPRAGRKALRPPPWVLASCSALALGILALAGPGPDFTQEPRQWTVVFDRGPGMSLPWVPSAQEQARTDPAQISRAEVALGMIETHLSEITGERDCIRWEAAGREPLDLAPGELPDWGWLRPLRAEVGGSPPWNRFTSPGSIWVSDRHPRESTGQAGLILSGGGPVPGPVAALGSELVRWSPRESLDSVPRQRGAVLLLQPPPLAAEQGEQRDRPALPQLLDELVRAWARSRGLGSLRVVPFGEGAGPSQEDDLLAGDEVVLVIEGCGPPVSDAVIDSNVDSNRRVPNSVPFLLRETGYSAKGICARGPFESNRRAPAGRTPLRAVWRGQGLGSGPGSAGGDGLPLLFAGPGWVRFTIQELDPPTGDPAAFAVRVAALLDRSLLLPPGVVPLDARRDAGPKLVQHGEDPARVLVTSDPSIAGLGVWLAGLAALAAFVAVASRR